MTTTMISMTTDYTIIPGFSLYEINRNGDVRVRLDAKPPATPGLKMKLYPGLGSPWYLLSSDKGFQMSAHLDRLLLDAFGIKTEDQLV